MLIRIVLSFFFLLSMQSVHAQQPGGYQDPRGNRNQWDNGQRQNDGGGARRGGSLNLGRIQSECRTGGGFYAQPNSEGGVPACYCPAAMRCIHTMRGTCRGNEVAGATIDCPLSNDALRAEWRRTCAQNFNTALAAYRQEQDQERDRRQHQADLLNSNARSRAFSQNWARNGNKILGLGAGAVVLGLGSASVAQTLRMAVRVRDLLGAATHGGQSMQFSSGVSRAFFNRQVQIDSATRLTTLNRNVQSGIRLTSRAFGLRISPNVRPMAGHALKNLNAISSSMGNAAESMRKAFFDNPSRLMNTEVNAAAVDLEALATTVEKTISSEASADYQAAATGLAAVSRDFAGKLRATVNCAAYLDRKGDMETDLVAHVANWAGSAQKIWTSLAQPASDFTAAASAAGPKLSRARNFGFGVMGSVILIGGGIGLVPVLSSAMVTPQGLESYEGVPGNFENNVHLQPVEYLFSHYPYTEGGVRVDTPEAACTMIVASEAGPRGQNHVPWRLQELMLRTAGQRHGVRPAGVISQSQLEGAPDGERQE